MIINYFTILFIFLSVSGFSQADTTFWLKTLETGANINQTSFSPNWKGGGIPSVALSGFFNLKSDRNIIRHRLVNEVQLAFGQFYNQPSNIKWRKNMDRIYIDNKYSYSLNNPWAAFVSLVFQTQFYKGYKFDKYKQPTEAGKDSATLISNFLAPGYLDEAMGFEYKSVPWFSARLGLLSARQIFSTDAEVTSHVKNAEGKHYGVSPGVKVRNQFGLNATLKVDKDLTDNINVKSVYQYFSEYKNLAVSTHRLDAIFTARLTSVINVNLQMVVLYNQDQDLKTQWSEAMAVGVSYKLSNGPSK